jgi:hypothetical protein
MKIVLGCCLGNAAAHGACTANANSLYHIVYRESAIGNREWIVAFLVADFFRTDQMSGNHKP